MVVLKFVLFIGIVLAVFLGAHYFLYKGLVRLYYVDDAKFKVLLFTSLFILAVSFIASFFLLRWYENQLTIRFYMVSAIWMGVFINLLLAVALSWIICGIVWLAGSHINTRVIVTACLIASVLYSAYGIWNAFVPNVQKLEIEFKNLPPHWKNKTIVQLSDIHLGHFYRVRFLINLIKKVNAIRPDIIFITGDLFDGMISHISHFAKPLAEFRAEKGVYFVSGNHETYIGLDRALKVLKETNIRVLQNEVIEIDGLQIVGISYPGIKSAEEIRGFEKLPSNPSDGKPCILLFHTPSNISPHEKDRLDQHFNTYWAPDTSFATNKRLGVNLQLSGHTHKGQIFPFNYLTRLIYKGYDYGLQQEGNFSIYTTSGVGTWGPPLRTGNKPEIVVIKLK